MKYIRLFFVPWCTIAHILLKFREDFPFVLRKLKLNTQKNHCTLKICSPTKIENFSENLCVFKFSLNLYLIHSWFWNRLSISCLPYFVLLLRGGGGGSQGNFREQVATPPPFYYTWLLPPVHGAVFTEDGAMNHAGACSCLEDEVPVFVK